MHLIVKEQIQDFRERGWEILLTKVDSFSVVNNIEVVNIDDIIKSHI